MWSFLFQAAIAIVLTVFQVAFFSRLPAPFPDISIPIVAMTLATVSGSPLAAAVWALAAGTVLGLHGLFGFGTYIIALFAALAIRASRKVAREDRLARKR